MILPSIRAAITAAGGTPTQVTIVDLLRELVTAYGGTPTQFTTIGLLREAVTAKGGTPTQFTVTGLLRELLTAGGVTPPTTFYEEDFWAGLASIVPPSSGPTNHVLNGTFPGDDTTNVTLSSPLNVSGGVLHMANTSGFTKSATFATDATAPAATVCTIEFDVSNFVAAPTGISLNVYGTQLSTQPITANGHYTFNISSSASNSTVSLQSRNNSNYDVDNVKCTWSI